ncbi:hypothetical protein EVG20_g2515 [Dentipellis fragilis]|uniref:Uncharacterized protein n=1 Tax=Dentipellis fragilis TaxID=205917 RepID=A0A4Y9Z9L6_9AGAM|nr:hypothetical protein EVG20_g2515 [Dentipellis fragilis]
MLSPQQAILSADTACHEWPLAKANGLHVMLVDTTLAPLAAAAVAAKAQVLSPQVITNTCRDNTPSDDTSAQLEDPWRGGDEVA